MTLKQLDRYQITGTLGKGATGTVYRAHDPLIDRTVAIKTVDCAGFSREQSEAFEESFYREAKSAGRLNHRNIVTIHDVGRSGDLVYIAMEFLDGRSLREILDSGVVLPLEHIAKIAIQIADGLAFAHANHVVHRDIKPANIMVTGNNWVKIADFGVAMLPNTSLGSAGFAQGSPRYMAPEQIAGQNADNRSDIFSLGVVLYEMLTGRPPFNGSNIKEVLDQVLHTAPPLPSSFHPDLPQGFDRVVARAMAKDPEKRYQNAAEMAAQLRKYRRMVIEAKREQNPPPASAPSAAAAPPSGVVGAETVQIRTKRKPVHVPAPARRTDFLRLGVPLIVTLGILLAVGWWWLRPANTPSPVIAKPEPAPILAPASASSAAETPSKADVAATAPANAAFNSPTASVSANAEPPPAVEASPAVTSPPATARVQLAISPWGEIYVDGKKAGTSPPLTTVKLPAGKHSIEIRNTHFKPLRQSVNLAPGGNLRIKHKFE